MIIDTIDNIKNYFCMHEDLEKVFGYVHAKVSVKTEPGMFKIPESKAYFLVQKYKPKDPVEGKWESHLQFIDVQYILSGTEQIGYAPITCLQAESDYNAERDVIRYAGGGEGCYIKAVAGTFFVFFPQDGHMPAVSNGYEGEVWKVVIKLPVSEHTNSEIFGAPK